MTGKIRTCDVATARRYAKSTGRERSMFNTFRWRFVQRTARRLGREPWQVPIKQVEQIEALLADLGLEQSK